MNILNMLSGSKKLGQLLLNTPAPGIALLALPGPLTAHIRPLTPSPTWMLFSPCPQLTPHYIGSQNLLQHKHLHCLASANNFWTVLVSERKERRNLFILGSPLFLVRVPSSCSFFKYTKEGLPWCSRGQDSKFTKQGLRFRSW